MLKKMTRLMCCGNSCTRILNWLYCILRKNLDPFLKRGTRVKSIVKDIYADMQFWNANSAHGWPRQKRIYSKVSNLSNILNVKHPSFFLKNTYISGDFYSLPAKKSPSTALLIGPTVPNMEPVLIIGCRSFPLNVYLPLDIDLIRFVVV